MSIQQEQHEIENQNQLEWESIRWKRAHTVVEKLQRKIFKYSQEENKKAMRAYQVYLVDSFSAKLIAVRKVTQDNRGKRTAGIDGLRLIEPAQRVRLAKQIKIDGKASKIRRILIPKPNSMEKRPLGIPTIADRAKQALLKMALEPEWEAKFEANSYGFRPGRSCQDAIAGIYLAIKAEPRGKYVLDADISKCFDKIDHKRLLEKLDTTPRIRKQISAWLEAGVQIGPEQTETPTRGTPQGGVISPLLANIALHGMENHLKQWIISQPVKDKHGKNLRKVDKMTSLALVRYADDFVIIHKDKWVIIEIKDIVERWLSTLGLELNKAKTQIKHTNVAANECPAGFNFLGFYIRRYEIGKYSRGKRGLNAKTLIKPSGKSIRNHQKQLREHENKQHGKANNYLKYGGTGLVLLLSVGSG